MNVGDVVWYFFIPQTAPLKGVVKELFTDGNVKLGVSRHGQYGVVDSCKPIENGVGLATITDEEHGIRIVEDNFCVLQSRVLEEGLAPYIETDPEILEAERVAVNAKLEEQERQAAAQLSKTEAQTEGQIDGTQTDS